MDNDLKKGLIIASAGAVIALVATLCQTILPVYVSSDSSDFSIDIQPMNIEATYVESDPSYLEVIDPSNIKKFNSTSNQSIVKVQNVHGWLSPYKHLVYLRTISPKPDIYTDFDKPEGKPDFKTNMTVYIKSQNQSLPDYPIIVQGIGSNGKIRNCTIFVTFLTPEDYVERGNNLSLKDKYEEAIKAYDKAIELLPKNEPSMIAPVWNRKGVALHKQGKYDDAIHAYDKAIQLDPKYPTPWNNKGEALYSLLKYDDAINAFNNAIESNPSYGSAWYNKGLALQKAGRTSEADESFYTAKNLGYEI